MNIHVQIHHTEKDVDLFVAYDVDLFVAYDNPKNAHKNAQKNSQNFKPSIHTVVSTGTNFTKNIAFHVCIGCVRLARYCGEMHRSAVIFFRTLDYKQHEKISKDSLEKLSQV